MAGVRLALLQLLGRPLSPLGAGSFHASRVSAQNNHRLSDYIEYAPVNKESISKVDLQVAPQLPKGY
jgi:hypothetical protein